MLSSCDAVGLLSDWSDDEWLMNNQQMNVHEPPPVALVSGFLGMGGSSYWGAACTIPTSRRVIVAHVGPFSSLHDRYSTTTTITTTNLSLSFLSANINRF
jgi:hypothetical protein